MKKIERLRLDNIYSTFRSGEEILPVLDGVSLTVMEGEFVTVIGPSGCGKSTILKIAAGLIKPDRGEVYHDGKSITGSPQLVGYMPQQDLLFPWKTLRQNAALPLITTGMSKSKAHEKVEKMLPLFGLEGFANYYPNQLSGGMKQRAALLRTMMVDSNIMLLDEPFAALDALTRVKMQDWLLQIWGKFKRSVLFITHSIDEAIYLSDRIYVISDRPGKNTIEQKIDLPRPRRKKDLAAAEFASYKQLLFKSL